MKASVVVPVYNAEKTIAATLASIEAQTFGGWECVCVDDGSTDGSAAILDAAAEKDPRIRVVHRRNAGVSAARNAGMDAATGEIVAFLDADDTFHPRALELFARARAETGADLIRYGWKNVDAHGGAWPELPADVAVRRVDPAAGSVSPMRQAACGAFSVVSRTLAGTVRWPAMTHCEDPLFLLRCLRVSGKIARIDATLAEYLLHEDSASHHISPEIIRATCRYLPLAYDECAALPRFAAFSDDTRAFVSGFLDGPLKGCWKKLPGTRREREAAKREVLRARWRMALRDAAFPRPRKGFLAALLSRLAAPAP